MSQGVIAIIGIILIFVGAIILGIRSGYAEKLNLYDVGSTCPEESGESFFTYPSVPSHQ